jgi:hypothetical protein
LLASKGRVSVFCIRCPARSDAQWKIRVLNVALPPIAGERATDFQTEEVRIFASFLDFMRSD